MRRLTFLALIATLATLVTALTGLAPTASAAPTDKPATKQVVVRPVTAAGAPAAGWTVTRESGTVDCYGSAPSSVDDGITACFPTAYGLRACWRSARHTVLCVRDVADRSLVRVRYDGRYPRATAPQVAQPAALALADGRSCLLRVGGAWGSPAQHPQWVGFDSCTRSADVYGGGAPGDGINRSSRTWTVKLWRHGVDPKGERLVTRAVTTAYVVGTAA